jgi:deoxyribonucleoside regulator
MKGPHRSPGVDAVQETLVQVAHMYYEENMTQQVIADRLGVSRSLIAQYLQRARDMDIVRIQIIEPNTACANLSATLEQATGVSQITVVPNPYGSNDLAIRAVSSAAANFLSEKLKDSDLFGLAWGRTTNLVVDFLESPHALGINVLPLMGECWHSGMHSQMNQLVMRAAEHLQAMPYFLSLPMVVSTPELRNALANEVGIRDVINLWGRVNLACVGIGVVPPLPGMVVYIGEEHLPRLLEAGAVGDICGVYYGREGQIIQSGLEDQMIAVNVDQLRAIDCLVAVACGVDKTVSVVGALRTGLLSALFIDQSMAEKIVGELSPVMKGQYKDGRK